jgi:hypothetical protein
MTAHRRGRDAGSPAHYVICVDGVLDPDWFEGLVVHDDGQHTIISGVVKDQSALHGLLAKVRDLGLCLIGVQRL